jgi:hypothetical protein
MLGYYAGHALFFLVIIVAFVAAACLVRLGRAVVDWLDSRG